MCRLLLLLVMHRRYASIDSLRAETLTQVPREAEVKGADFTFKESPHRSPHVHHTSVSPRIRFVYFFGKRRTLTCSLTQLVVSTASNTAVPQNTSHCLPLSSRKSNAFALHNSCHYLPLHRYFARAKETPLWRKADYPQVARCQCPREPSSSSQNSLSMFQPLPKTDLSAHMSHSLLSSGTFSDLTLTCCGKTFEVHKVVLCTQSKVFRKLLDGNFMVGKCDRPPIQAMSHIINPYVLGKRRQTHRPARRRAARAAGADPLCVSLHSRRHQPPRDLRSLDLPGSRLRPGGQVRRTAAAQPRRASSSRALQPCDRHRPIHRGASSRRCLHGREHFVGHHGAQSERQHCAAPEGSVVPGARDGVSSPDPIRVGHAG